MMYLATISVMIQADDMLAAQMKAAEIADENSYDGDGNVERVIEADDADK